MFLDENPGKHPENKLLIQVNFVQFMVELCFLMGGLESLNMNTREKTVFHTFFPGSSLGKGDMIS